jgi:hypothetical protein
MAHTPRWLRDVARAEEKPLPPGVLRPPSDLRWAEDPPSRWWVLYAVLAFVGAGILTALAWWLWWLP